MSLRKVEMVAAVCDLCQEPGPAAKQPEHAEQHAESVGITRFLNGTHCCGECRKMLSGEVEKPAAVKKAVGK